MTQTAHSIGSLDAVRAAGSQLVELEEKMIAIFCLGERVLAVEERCSHRAGPLSEGKLVDGRVVCPWHGSEFEISTGDVKKGPAKRCLKTHTVEIRQGEVFIKVNPEAPT
jgi:nitrite reductase/ring-hydroxylating ferredoxin subunit